MSNYSTANPVRALNDHNCFGCGMQNAGGLHLHFYRLADDRGIWAPWTPSLAYEGYNGMIHGGIISTLLDEIMAWSLYSREVWAVTAKMETTYRKPVEIGQDVVLVGHVERDRGRIFEMRGEIRRASDDALLAESRAVFMRVPEHQAQAWNARYLAGAEQL